MTPITALKMTDIQSNTVKLRSKPTAPNPAKTTRTAVRRMKRTRTWIDPGRCGRFGNWAKGRNSGKCAFAGLAEIVAADRLIERTGVARYAGNAGPALGRREILRFNERSQKRQGQI